jgi:hypothetical protein
MGTTHRLHSDTWYADLACALLRMAHEMEMIRVTFSVKEMPNMEREARIVQDRVLGMGKIVAYARFVDIHQPGMRPTINADLKAQWQAVQHGFSDHFTAIYKAVGISDTSEAEWSIAYRAASDWFNYYDTICQRFIGPLKTD